MTRSSGLSWRYRIWRKRLRFDPGCFGLLITGRSTCCVAEPIDDDSDVADPAQPDPLEMLMRKEAVKTAVSRFAELPTL
jgi:hypothetical protein